MIKKLGYGIIIIILSLTAIPFEFGATIGGGSEMALKLLAKIIVKLRKSLCNFD